MYRNELEEILVNKLDKNKLVRGVKDPTFFVAGASKALAATGHQVRKDNLNNRISAR